METEEKRQAWQRQHIHNRKSTPLYSKHNNKTNKLTSYLKYNKGMAHESSTAGNNTHREISSSVSSSDDDHDEENHLVTATTDNTDARTMAASAEQEELPQQHDAIRPLSDTNIPRICCALLASIVTGGTTYAFGLYGSALKRTLHLTQTQLDTISSANFCAGLLSWLPGMFVDRFGTRYGIILGGITGSTSLMLYWAVATRIITISDKDVIVAILSALGVMTFVSCALITGAVFKVISCSCGPGTKGSAVGVAKGYVGLGAGAFACLFESIRSPTSSDLDFLPMAATFFIICAAIPSWCFMEQKPVPDVLTPLHFRVLYSSLFSLAVVVVGTSLLTLYKEEHETFQKSTSGSDVGRKPNYLMAGVIITVWIGPLVAQLFIPQKEADTAMYSILGREDQDCLLGGEDDVINLDTHEPLTLDRVDKDKEDEEDNVSPSLINSNSNTNEGQLVGEHELCSAHSAFDEFEEGRVQDKNLFQMLKDPSAWVLLWISTIVVGGGTVETNNMGQMVESLKFPPVVTSASLALFSVAQAGGRVLTGVISEGALNWNTQHCCIDKGIPRPFFLVLASLVGVLAHAVLAISTEQTSFVIGTALSGLSFGGVWPMLVLIVGEIFGTAHVAANYMFYDGFTSAGGTYLLSKVVAQKVYESHIDRHYSEHNSDEVTCYGQECFQSTHIIISLLCLTCVGMSCLMMYTTRSVYNKTDLHIHSS